MLKKLRYLAEYCIILSFYLPLRFMPWQLMRCTAWGIGAVMNMLPGLRNLVRANIHAAMPELPPDEVNRIARSSFDHLIWNLLEYFWCIGNDKRIRRCCCVEEKSLELCQKTVREKKQFIFVTPHLGSWEVSGLMAPFYTGLRLAAIAKPVRNPYLNKLLNSGGRESTKGIKIIFSQGAIRASLQALREGWSIGTLIDQNTRLRDGGVFVDFFGLPVPSSTAPAVLQNYCNQKNIPCQIIFACSLRNSENKLVGRAWTLDKPFEEYSSPGEVLQELMKKSEDLIRKNPEQYLWMYRRFRYIPEDATPEQLSRYPWYAKRPSPKFYTKVKKSSSGTSDNGEIGA